jgi:hypothetical protein
MASVLSILPSAALAHCDRQLPAGLRRPVAHSAFTFNASFQYIDQDQSGGTQDVDVGAIPRGGRSAHQHRTTTFSAAYQGVRPGTSGRRFGTSTGTTAHRHHAAGAGTLRWTGRIGDLELAFALVRSGSEFAGS